LVGKKLDVIQTYPASEGFIAYQDRLGSEELLLLLNNSVFYEFIATDEFHNENPERISIRDVELGKDYVLILNTNAGLWGYNIGDTARFTSLNPFRIVVSVRIKHFTSAFGEHVIAHEVEKAIQGTLRKFNARVSKFTVAPRYNPEYGLPYHEWFIEFEREPENCSRFATELDWNLRKLNTYYADLI